MRVGVFTPLLSQLPLKDVLAKLKSLHISTVELATGNYPGDAHCKLTMLEDNRQLADFQRLLADQGFSISALSCHGNALHPNPARAKEARETSRKTILLAEKLGVPVVVDFSGCPGDSPQSTAPTGSPAPGRPIISRFSIGSGMKSSLRIGSNMESSPRSTMSKSQSKCIRASSYTARKLCCGCVPLRGLPLDAITIPATCSGKASTPSPPSAS